MKIPRIIGAALITAAVPVAAVATTATPAEAKVVCSAGTWGGNHGWGDCSENRVPGPRRWQLVTVCSWGSAATSGVISGRGHVDTTCPWPQSARYSYIRYY